MELTIPTEGMYRMWYVKTAVLKKNPPQTFKHIYTLEEAKITCSVNNLEQKVRY